MKLVALLVLTKIFSFVPFSQSPPLDDRDKSVLKQAWQTRLKRGSEKRLSHTRCQWYAAQMCV